MFEFTHLMPTNNCAHLFCDQIEKCLEAQPDDYNASTTYILDDNETTTLTNISTTELPSVNTTETVFYNKSNPQMMGKAYSQDPETQSIMITSENSSDIEHSTPTTISNVKHTINSNVNKTKDIIDHPRNGVTISKSKSLMSKGQQQELSGNFSTESGFLNWSDKVLNDSQNNDIYENEMYVHDNESLIIVVPTQLSNNNYYKKSHHHDMTSETKVNNEQISSFATDSFHSSLQMTVFGGNTNVNESFRVIQVLYPDIHQSVFLIISLIAGFLILLIVIGLIFKHVHNTWERRHYQKMNIMIE